MLQFLLMTVGISDHSLIEGDRISFRKLENEVVGRFLFEIYVRGHSAFWLCECGSVGPWHSALFTVVFIVFAVRQVAVPAFAAKGNPLA